MTSVKYEDPLLHNHQKLVDGMYTSARGTGLGPLAITDSLTQQQCTGRVSEDGSELDKVSVHGKLDHAEKTFPGILCSKTDSSRIIEEYFTSLLQRPTLYPYDDDEFQSIVESIPPFTVLYIIVNEGFFRVLQKDISAMKQMLNNMLENKQYLYFMNFLNDEDDFMEVNYNLPRAARNGWIDKESFIKISDEEDIMPEPTKTNQTEIEETNTKLQIGNGNRMEVNTVTDNTSSTQIGGNALYEYRNDSTVEGIVLTIKTPEANHRLDVTIKKHIDDNLLHINAKLQDLHVQVISTDQGSVIIRLSVDEVAKLGSDWLKKIITTILSEDILANLPVGTKMEVNIQASLSLKPLDGGIFETTTKVDGSDCLENQVEIIHGGSLVHKVAAKGSTKLLDTLIKFGIDVNEKNNEGESLLHTATKAGNVEAVKLLVAAGANITVRDDCNRTPLHIAAMTGNTKCTEALMRLGRSKEEEIIEIPEPDKNKSVSYQIVEGLLAAGADINAKDHNSNTPLHAAAITGELDILNMLLKHEPDVRCINSNGQTPLHLAMAYGNFKWGLLLVEHDKGTLHIKDEEGNTPLHEMAENILPSDFETLFMIPPIEGHTEETPLQCATMHEQIESVYALARLGADVNITDEKGRAPLHLILSKQNIASGHINIDLECARQFIKFYKGDKLNVINMDGNSPLLTAVLRKQLQIACCLIEGGADVNIASIRGETVLHAIANLDIPCLDLIRIVLANGADVNAKDFRGDTPLNVSMMRNNELVTRELLAAGANDRANDSRMSSLELMNETMTQNFTMKPSPLDEGFFSQS